MWTTVCEACCWWNLSSKNNFLMTWIIIIITVIFISLSFSFYHPSSCSHIFAAAVLIESFHFDAIANLSLRLIKREKEAERKGYNITSWLFLLLLTHHRSMSSLRHFDQHHQRKRKRGFGVLPLLLASWVATASIPASFESPVSILFTSILAETTTKRRTPVGQ